MSLSMMRSAQTTRPSTVSRRSTVTVQARKTIGQKTISGDSKRQADVEACEFFSRCIR